jgi:hypothetical protein
MFTQRGFNLINIHYFILNTNIIFNQLLGTGHDRNQKKRVWLHLGNDWSIARTYRLVGNQIQFYVRIIKTAV